MKSANAGFTLVETLVATALTLLVMSAVLSVATPGAVLARMQPEAAEMQQRARVGADTMLRDLLGAGAGLDTGPDAGSLVAFLPPAVPRRMGLTGSDSPDVVRADAITLTWIESGFAQATSSAPISSSAPSLAVAVRPPCPPADVMCGFTDGADALVFDDQGHFDMFRVANVAAGSAELRRHGTGIGYDYPAGTHVAVATTRIYYLDPVSRQLRMTDGYLSDQPVVDNVVGLTFSYFGDPDPPIAPRPAAGTANCLYDEAGRPVSGMPRLATAGASLAPLPLSLLNDGPWCGENDNRFDADLLRVRQIRVTLRVQSADASFRAAGAWFAVPGTASRSDQLLADYVLTLDVTPRNLVPRGAPWSS
jgi:type II secretory pathway pseudopilin PulG